MPSPIDRRPNGLRAARETLLPAGRPILTAGEPLEADPARPRGRRRARPLPRGEGVLPGVGGARLRAAAPGHRPPLRRDLARGRLRRHAGARTRASSRPGGLLLAPPVGAEAGPRVPEPARPALRQGRAPSSPSRVSSRARHRLARPLHPGEPVPLARQQRRAGGGRLRRARGVGPHGAAPARRRSSSPWTSSTRRWAASGSLLARLTPLGIFAIAGNTAGTMQLEEFERLQGFVLTYVVFACLLTFWLLPGLVSALTRVGHRRIVALAQDALRDRVRHVEPLHRAAHPRRAVAHPPRRAAGDTARRRRARERARGRPRPDLLQLPARREGPLASASCCSPAGTWASPIPAARVPRLAGAGLLAVFGSINTAMPFLLDLARVPADLFQLFVVSGVVNSRFGAMTSAMHTLVVAVLGTCLVTGRIELRRAALARYVLVSLVLVAAAVLGTRAVLARILPDPARAADVSARSRRGHRSPRRPCCGLPRPRPSRRSPPGAGSPRSSPAASCGSGSTTTRCPGPTSTRRARSRVSTRRWRTRSRSSSGSGSSSCCCRASDGSMR